MRRRDLKFSVLFSVNPDGTPLSFLFQPQQYICVPALLSPDIRKRFFQICIFTLPMWMLLSSQTVLIYLFHLPTFYR